MNMIYSSKDRSLCVISFDTKMCYISITIHKLYVTKVRVPQKLWCLAIRWKIPYREIQKTAVICSDVS